VILVPASRQLQETSRGLVLLPPKSIAGNRVLALDPWTLQVLAAPPRPAAAARGVRRVRLRPPGRTSLPARVPDAQVRQACTPGGTAPDPAPRPQARRCHPRPGQRRRPQGDPGHARPREHYPDRRHLHQRAARPRPRNGGGGGSADPGGRPDTPGLTAASPWPHAPATCSPAGVRNRRPGPVGRQGVEP
jgi:hypothetical protein